MAHIPMTHSLCLKKEEYEVCEVRTQKRTRKNSTLKKLQYVEARFDYNNDQGFMCGLWKLVILKGHNYIAFQRLNKDI